jgi:hypothetical protein
MLDNTLQIFHACLITAVIPHDILNYIEVYRSSSQERYDSQGVSDCICCKDSKPSTVSVSLSKLTVSLIYFLLLTNLQETASETHLDEALKRELSAIEDQYKMTYHPLTYSCGIKTAATYA